MIYFLFGGYKDVLGGAEDFHSVHANREDAEVAGIAYYLDGDSRLNSWMHLASFDGTKMDVRAWLNIPGTEEAETENLEWIDYE